MKRKAIVLARVSTDIQDITEQEKNLIDFAIKDGFDINNIIVISDKESAIKLSEEERNGLNALKNYILNDSDIKCVYVWEISRISRIPKVLYSIRDLLIDYNIQLKVYEPSFVLLNTDNSINENSALIFALYASMAESETRMRKQRFKRSKQRDARLGKYNGGKVKFGYKIDDDRNYIIDDAEANIIRMIYKYYLNGLSQAKIAKEMTERGLINKRQAIDFVNKILTSEEYTGYSEKYGFERIYPIIIPKETYEKCRIIASENSSKQVKARNIYFGHSLIRCKECGRKYIANISSKMYLCSATRTDDYRMNGNIQCSQVTLNINTLDSLLWHISKNLYEETAFDNLKNETIELKEKLPILRDKIFNTAQQKEKIKGKIERNSEMYIDGAISKEKYLSIKAKLINDENELEFKRKSWMKEMNSIYHKLTHFRLISQDTILQSINTANDEERFKIIHSVIEKVVIENVKNFTTKMVSISTFSGITRKFIIQIKTKKYFEIINNKETILDVIYLNRFIDDTDKIEQKKEWSKKCWELHKDRYNATRNAKLKQKRLEDKMKKNEEK